MTKPDKQRLMCIILTLCVLLTACSLQLRTDCAARNSRTPEISLYPGSQVLNMVNESSQGVGELRYTYQVEDTPDNVAAFYREISYCRAEITNGKLVCGGEANPFGRYSLHIDYADPNTTRYDVFFIWDKCTSDWSG